MTDVTAHVSSVDPSTSQAMPPEKTDDPCLEHPDRVGCMDGGQPDDSELQRKEVGQSITPVSMGGPGSCPADKSHSFMGKTVTWSYAPICQGATLMRPVVLAIAWLLAAMIVVGAMRE